MDGRGEHGENTDTVIINYVMCFYGWLHSCLWERLPLGGDCLLPRLQNQALLFFKIYKLGGPFRLHFCLRSAEGVVVEISREKCTMGIFLTPMQSDMII